MIVIANYYIRDGLFNYMVNIFSFEAMAVGGLGAYLVFNRQSPFSNSFLYQKPIQIAIYLVLACYLIVNINIDNVIWNSIFKLPIISKFVIDFMFLYLIIGVSIVDNSVIKLKNKTLSFLGEISYGIYMYHMLIIFAIMLFLRKYILNLDPILGIVIFYIILTSSVILVSYISKIVFENYFLNLKSKIGKVDKPPHIV